MLESLSKQYVADGLPLPPAEAPLMKIFSGTRSTVNGETTLLYFLGYRLTEGESAAKPGTFLVGTEVYVPDHHGPEAPAPQPADPAKPLPAGLAESWAFGPPFPVDIWLALVCQSHLRGDDKLARQILDSSLGRRRGFGGPTAVSSGRGWRDSSVNQSMAEPEPSSGLNEKLAATAWNHGMNRAVQNGTDRREILARLERLRKAWPSLDGPYQRAYVESLRLTAEPGRGQPGSAEALIDGLTEMSVRGGRMGSADPTADPNYAALQARGFEAVPALIAHLDDRRLTRAVTEGFNNFRTLPRRVGEVASDLIEALAGSELDQDWLSRQLGNSADAKPVEQWWEKARAVGEEAYAVGHVLPVTRGENDQVNTACLSIVEARYPGQLGLIYERLLRERPDLESYQIVQAIGRSEKLPQNEKLRLLREGIGHEDLRLRERALTELFRFEPHDVKAWIVRELDQMPAEAATRYWTCPEANLTRLVLLSDAPEVWEAFARAARRASVGLRLELMNPLNYCYLEDELRAQRLTFLAGFFDDETVRVIGKSGRGDMYEGPCAAFTFPTISVRNFAGLKAGSLLKVPDVPEPGWDEARWESYRAKVRAALDKR